MKSPLLFLLFFYFCAGFNIAGKALRVNKAKNVDYRKHKHLVCLKIKKPGGLGTCSGSIISDRWILTAAHCFNKADSGNYKYNAKVQRIVDNKWVMVGVVDKIITHPKFTPGRKYTKYESDLAVIKTIKPMPLGTYLKPIKLSKLKIQDTIPAIVVGYGVPKFDFDGPTQRELVVLPCEQDPYSRFGRNLLCSDRIARPGPPDLGGSALVSADGEELIGVTSSGCDGTIVVLGTEAGSQVLTCEPAFVDIAPYLDWIKKKTGIE